MSAVVTTTLGEAHDADEAQSVLAAFGWALARDVRIALRSKAELGVQLLFYVIVVSLFPLAASPSRDVLGTLGPGVLWTAALLASLLSLPRLFTSDFADGTLEQIALSPRPLTALVSGKIAAHWLTTGLPVALMAPVLGAQYALDSALLGMLSLSLLIGTISVAISLTLGAILGLVAGFFRGIVDTAIMRLMDVMLALPSLLLAIAVVAILGPGLVNAMYAIAIVLLPHYVRLARAAVIAESRREYVTSSRVAGAGNLRLMFATILPNCAAPLIVQATLAIAAAVIAEASLSFLGLGQQPPAPSWGSMLNTAKNYVDNAAWMAIWPGLSIFGLVLSFNLLGDGLRDALDPRLKAEK